MKPYLSSLTEEQIARFGEVVSSHLGLAVADFSELGAGLVQWLMESVADDEQTLVLVKLDTPNKHVAKQLMLDALGELRDRRDPPQDYVNRRYAEHDQKFRDNKLPQIKEKVRLVESYGIDV